VARGLVVGAEVDVTIVARAVVTDVEEEYASVKYARLKFVDYTQEVPAIRECWFRAGEVREVKPVTATVTLFASDLGRIRDLLKKARAERGYVSNDEERVIKEIEKIVGTEKLSL
jgi:hypothetical protein